MTAPERFLFYTDEVRTDTINQMNWLNSKYTLWISGMMFVIFQTTIIFILRSVDSPLAIIRQQTTLSPAEFQNFLVQWGTDRISIFVSHYYFDFFHPFIYSVFLAACLIHTRAVRRHRWLLFFPFFAGGFDEIENIIQLPMALEWMNLSSQLFYLGAMSSRLKWIFVATSVGIILLGLVRILRDREIAD